MQYSMESRSVLEIGEAKISSSEPSEMGKPYPHMAWSNRNQIAAPCGERACPFPAAPAKSTIPPPVNPHTPGESAPTPGRERRPRRSVRHPRHRTRSGESATCLRIRPTFFENRGVPAGASRTPPPTGGVRIRPTFSENRVVPAGASGGRPLREITQAVPKNRSRPTVGDGVLDIPRSSRQRHDLAPGASAAVHCRGWRPRHPPQHPPKARSHPRRIRSRPGIPRNEPR